MKFVSKCGSYALRIHPRLVDKIIEFSKAALPDETCGCIVGYYEDNLLWAVVTDVILACKDPALKGCQIDNDFVNDYFTKLWKETDGQRYDLGVWYSHPLHTPVPSEKDNKVMQEVYRKEDDQKRLSIIIGYNLTRDDLHVRLYENETDYVDLERWV